MAIGYTLAVGMVFAVGYLRGEGILQGADPRDLAMLLIAPYGLGLVIARRRYR